MTETAAAIRQQDLTDADFEYFRQLVERKRGYLPVKRGIDMLAAAALLILLSPLLVGVAALVRFDTPGPALYRAKRRGRDGKPFDMLKFRSMRVAPEADDLTFRQRVSGDGSLAKGAGDRRITSVGRWIRRLSLDELPQLLNVVRGDMSMIGPRPILPEMLDHFPVFESARALVRPGISGLWQVRERANATHVTFMWRHDLEYLGRISLWCDMGILLRTALVTMRRTGAV